MRRAHVLALLAAACLIYAAATAYGADDTPAGAGLHLRVAPVTRGVVPYGKFVARFSVNYSGPGNSGDIFLSFVAVDGQNRKLGVKLSAPGLRRQRPSVPHAASMLVRGVSSAGTRFVRATFSLRADGKICVRNSRAWLVDNPSDFRARTGGFCNYVKTR
jgi:hypothetical protein